jgi:hypothetical protein
MSDLPEPSLSTELSTDSVDMPLNVAVLLDVDRVTISDASMRV